MRIADLTTEQGFDTLCEIVPHLGAIITDDELLGELKRKTGITDTSTKAEIWAAALDKITALMPIILKKHRAEVYGVIAAINGKTADEINKQSFLVTAGELRDIINDADLRSFFASLWNTERA